MVGQMATTMRNSAVQGANVGLHILEDAAIDTMLGVVGAAKKITTGEGPKLRTYWTQTAADLNATLAIAMGGGKRLLQATGIVGKKDPFARPLGSQITQAPGIGGWLTQVKDHANQFYKFYDDFLDSVSPMERARLESSPIAGDVFSRSIFNKDYWKTQLERMGVKGERVGAAMEVWGDVFTAGNRLQEMEFRRWFFLRGVHKGMRKHGYGEDWGRVINDLKNLEGGLGSQFIPSTGKALMSREAIQTSISQLRKDPLVVQEMMGGRYGKYQSQLDQPGMVKTFERARSDTRTKINKNLDEVEAALAEGDVQAALSKLHPDLAERFGGRIAPINRFIAEATDEALKQTFAFTDQRHTLQGKMLATINDLPFLLPVVSYFPRFLTNMWMWLMDRNPMEIRQFVGPNFLKEGIKSVRKGELPKTLFGKELKALTGKKGPVGRDLEYMHQIARASEGIVMVSLAHMIRNSPMAGPKYYQLKVGQDAEGTDLFMDLRPYQPFAQVAFLTEAFKAVGEGKMPNLTAAEMTDAMIGVRRMSEMPIFAVPDLIRSVESSTPEAFFKSIKTLIGQPLAAPFTPMKTIVDGMAAMGITENPELKDVAGNELLGPLMAATPGGRDVLVPPRINPITGKPMVSEHPGLRQLAGLSIQKLTPLEQTIRGAKISGRTISGEYYNPDANRLVDELIGKILSRETGGRTVGDAINQAVLQRTGDMPIEYRREMLRQVFAQVRKAAVMQARTIDNSLFRDYDIRTKVPEPFRPMWRAQK